MRMLDAVLERVSWDPSRRGPLIAVDPGNTEPAAAEPLPPRPPGGLALRAVARHFDRKVVSLETLTALAPRTMVVLNTRPGRPDFRAGLGRDKRLLHLLGSLDAGQWSKLGGAEGLGMGDLTPEQRPLFLAFLPDPFRVARVRKSDGWLRKIPEEEPVTVDPGAVRMRLRRAADLLLPGKDDEMSNLLVRSLYPQPEGAEFFEVARAGYEDRSPPDAFGRALRRTVRSRPKPGHLAFDAPELSAPIGLNGAATAGDLVARAAEAAGLEIHADRRVALLPVWVRGDQARAGDVLKALSLAVTGAFRKLGPAYVLTDDLEGIGARHALRSDWAANAKAEQEGRESALWKRIKDARPFERLAFAPADPLTLPPERSGATGAPHPLGREMPVTAMPPPAQAFVRDWLSRVGERGRSVDPDRARLMDDLRLYYLVPGVDGAVLEEGAHEAGSWQGFLKNLASNYARIDQPAPPGPAGPLALPADGKTRALLVAPRTPDEAARAATEARRCGLTQLWVSVPTASESGDDVLSAAIAAGQAAHLPVLAVVRLLRQATHRGPAGTGPLDINILGETGSAYAARRAPSVRSQPWLAGVFDNYGDWLRPETRETAAALERRLVELAATPGLAGLVVRDAAARGYDEREEDNRGERTDSGDWGYSLENRLSFLREHGADPIDLLAARGSLDTDVNPPFFPDSNRGRVYRKADGEYVEYTVAKEMRAAWHAARFEMAAGLRADLFAAIRAANPELPLFVQASSPVAWYSSWDQGDRLPRTRWPARGSYSVDLMARAQGRCILHNHTYRGDPKPDHPRYHNRPRGSRAIAASLLRPMKDWDGLVLDLSEMSTEQALPLLERSVFPHPGNLRRA